MERGSSLLSSPAALRWLQRSLVAVGVVCLGFYAWSWIDARWYQYRQNRAFEEARNAPAPAAPASGPRPAAETDALAAFREAGAPPQRRFPDGSLIGRLQIERLGLSVIVLEGVGAGALRRGAGHIPSTALPGGTGNVGLAAHRDTFFRPLKDIRQGDRIVFETVDGTYRYQVEWTQIVLPEDTYVLDDPGSPVLTLVTCYPFYYVGSAPKRFIVRATLTP